MPKFNNQSTSTIGLSIVEAEPKFESFIFPIDLFLSLWCSKILTSYLEDNRLPIKTKHDLSLLLPLTIFILFKGILMRLHR